MIKEVKMNTGYTLIELLAVVSLLVIISGVVTGILYSTLRGSNKTRITTAITQNGNYAISVFTTTVIDSRNIVEVGGVSITDCTASPSGTSITFERLSGGRTTLSCSGGGISSNSASLIDTSAVQVAEDSCYFYCNQTTDDAYATPIVGIIFDLEEASGSTMAETQGSATFNSAASLRNYAP